MLKRFSSFSSTLLLAMSSLTITSLTSQPPPVFDVVVIGSGISGLLTAELVLGSMPATKVLVVEKSTQIGGRAKIISQNSPFDLGGAWTWSDQRLNALTKRLGIEKFKQPSDGVDVILQDLYGGGQRQLLNTGGQLLACGPGAERLQGGVGGVPVKLAEEVVKRGGEVRLSTSVTKIGLNNDIVTLNDSIQTKFVVIAAPPQMIATHINFSPPLPSKQTSSMLSTQTWMYNTGKAIVEYDKPWWKEGEGKLSLCSSGTSRLGGHVEVTWDNSDYGNGKYAIGMFVKEGANEENVRAEIAQIFGSDGDKIKGITGVDVKIWSDVGVPGGSPATYGSRILREEHLEGRVVFSGTETEDEHGHIEGAVISGERAAETIIAKLRGEMKAEEL
ncbi:hypothetical protein TrLO_g1355 [Triparma laevis f. longispina]|uniref:monoamine oxidase n=1 Tax=Triparma laevis f. longispina TaxID=1714387 RepID=A0A9W7KXL9_9STRA|nr:hypothetical protein TrLO_g1355 [Triparma laevis f. longispina]